MAPECGVGLRVLFPSQSKSAPFSSGLSASNINGALPAPGTLEGVQNRDRYDLRAFRAALRAAHAPRDALKRCRRTDDPREYLRLAFPSSSALTGDANAEVTERVI